MGILVNTGFDVGSSSPIDSRTLKNTIDERDALVTDGLVYENLKVYCKDTQKEYRWTGTEWETVVGSGGDLDLTDYQKKTDNTLTTIDKTVTGAINEIYGTQLDTVGFSADYKNIILNRKNGLNPYTIPISAIINNASLTELKDIDSTDIGNGKILVYDGVTNKHKYVDSSTTDEFVKMDGTTDAKYLSDLIDKSTVVNDNGVLKVKKLDGQEVTITEINYLKGLTMNVMDLVSAFANGGVKVLNTPLNTASELDTMDRTSFIEGISYIVYVLADETHAGAKTTYLVDKTNTTFFGNADSQRNFTTNPIDLANEVTGKLDNSHIDIDSLWTLLTINDTYKTLTTNNEIFGTHGAKAMYDELTTKMGAKANTSDIPTKVSELTNDAGYISEVINNLTSTDTDKPLSANQGKILKDELGLKANANEVVKKTDITDTININSSDKQIPTVKAIYNDVMEGKIIDQTVIDTYGTEILKYPLGIWRISNDNIANKFSDLPIKRSGRIEITSINSDINVNPWDNVWSYRTYNFETFNDMNYFRKLGSADTAGVISDTGWQKIAIQKDLDELFQSVSNGKTLVANAITGKGVSTATDATFATMATNISKISVSSYKEETKSYTTTSSGITPLTITFSANVLGVKQVIPPTYSCRISTQTSGEVFTINGKELILYVTGEGTWKVTALIEA